MTQKTAYLAPRELEKLVVGELKNIESVHDRLIIANGPPQTSYWSQNIWFDPIITSITSVGDAAKILRAVQKNWSLYSFKLHRRAKLVQEKLAKTNVKPIKFPSPLPSAPMGSWTLLEEDVLLYSAHCSSPFVHGDPIFAEDKKNPPSRAYLKLWETFTLMQRWPKAGDVCLDLGASPGGWSWVLAMLGAQVIALDRAPLAPSLDKMQNIEFRKGNAFAAKPSEFPEVNWFFSDVICYPDKLFEFVSTWMKESNCRNFVCTLKFQGDEHYNVIEKFAAIPGSRLLHLGANKHELTWILIQE